MSDIKPLENYQKKIASEIEEALGENHISTMMYGTMGINNSSAAGANNALTAKKSKEPIRLFIVVKQFNEKCLISLSIIFEKWCEELGERLVSPYITEETEFKGILDSVPEKVLELKSNYQVIAGDDLEEMSSDPEYEYLRAQIELTIRQYVYTLRHDLFEVLFDRKSMEDYLREIWVFCIGALRYYHMITNPSIKSTTEHFDSFKNEFPESKEVVHELLEKFYQVLNSRPIESIGKTNLLKLSINVLSKILQPLLLKIDDLGPNEDLKKRLQVHEGDLIGNTINNKIGNKIGLKILSPRRSLKPDIDAMQKSRDLDLQRKLKLLLNHYKTEYNKKVEAEVIRIRDALAQKFEAELEKRETTMTENYEIDKANYSETKLSVEREKLERKYKKKLQDIEKRYKQSENKSIKIFNEKEKRLLSKFKRTEIEMKKNYSANEKELKKKFKQKEQELKELELRAHKEYEELADKLRFELDMSKKENESRARLENEILERKQSMKKLMELEFECEKSKLEVKCLEFDLNLKERELSLVKTKKRPGYYYPDRDLAQDDIGAESYQSDSGRDLYEQILADNKSLKWNFNNKKNASPK